MKVKQLIKSCCDICNVQYDSDLFEEDILSVDSGSLLGKMLFAYTTAMDVLFAKYSKTVAPTFNWDSDVVLPVEQMPTSIAQFVTIATFYGVVGDIAMQKSWTDLADNYLQQYKTVSTAGNMPVGFWI